MNLGTAEAWTLEGLPDAERHLREGAVLAREIGRPYLEVACLAQLGFASKVHPFATTQARCREAMALAEHYGWGTEPLSNLAQIASFRLVNTVDASPSIYAKLQVRDRSSAVQRARELRLLAAGPTR